MSNRTKAPIRTTKAATAMRELITAAREDTASYGTRDGGPQTFRFFSFRPTRLQQIQSDAYGLLVWKLLNERLDALPDEEADKLRAAQRYWLSTPSQRNLIDIRNQYENLSGRVAKVENELGIKI